MLGARAKPARAVEKLGLKRVREILGSKAKENITALIAKDKALEPEATSIANVEKLLPLSCATCIRSASTS
jgi:hypothetical protein